MKQKPIHLQPDKNYLLKLYLGVLFGLFIPGIWLVPIVGLASFKIGGVAAGVGGAIVAVITVAAITYSVVAAYYRCLHYEIRPDEVIVYKGLITKTVKHVPFRTITNLEVTRGLVDRLLGLGSLSIQTAGASGTIRPEEKLVGLSDVEDVYEYVAQQLRRFRSALSPTQAGDEISPPLVPVEQELLTAILHEIRAFRVEFEQFQDYVANNTLR